MTKVAVSGEKRVFVAGLDTQKLVARYSMTPEQHARALAAAKRFDEARLDEAEQVALVDAMKGVLPGEDRDDFRAALARRPVVQRGGSTVVFTKTLGKIDNPSLVDALVVER